MENKTISETWYRTQPAWRGKRIVPIEVSRYTEHYVYLVGEKGRHPRSGQYESYFPTFDRAHRHLLTETERELESAKGRLDRAEIDLKKIQELQLSDSASTNEEKK